MTIWSLWHAAVGAGIWFALLLALMWISHTVLRPPARNVLRWLLAGVVDASIYILITPLLLFSFLYGGLKEELGNIRFSLKLFLNCRPIKRPRT